MRLTPIGLCLAAVLAAPAVRAQAGDDTAAVKERIAVFELSWKDGTPDGKVRAIIALVAKPHSLIVRPLAKALQDPSDAVGAAAAQAIAYTGATLGDLEVVRAVNVLAAALQGLGHRPAVAAACCREMAQLRHKAAVPPLLGQAGAKNQRVAEAAMQALRSLSGETHATPAAWKQWWRDHAATFEPAPWDAAAKGPSPPKPPAPRAPDPVSRAIDKAADWLLSRHPEARGYRDREAIDLLALAYAGRTGDPRFQAALRGVEGGALTSVYEVAVQLMVLQKVNPQRYQQAIARRAWWLVNSQGESGAWTYGGPGLPVPTQLARAGITRSRFGKAVATGALREGDNPMQVILVERTAPWAKLPAHDLSNTQIAVLALYAAEQAHIRCPEETWQRIEKAFTDGSVRGGGWSYVILKMAVPTAGMTAGGIGSLAMVRELLDQKSAGRKALMRAGWKRLDRWGPFGEWRTGKSHPSGDRHSLYFYYWLYSLERAAVLEQRTKLGGTDWFAKLSRYLVAEQRPDGAWGPPDDHDGRSIVYWGNRATERAICTAFAILFLARAAPQSRVQITKSLQKGPSEPK